jgi:hypothetical protein
MRRAAFVIASGLLTASCSQIVYIPPSLDGTPTTVDVTWDGHTTHLDKQGYAFYVNGALDGVYRVDADSGARDFAPVLATMRETVAAGRPELPHSYAILLEQPGSPVGSLSFAPSDGGPQQRLERAGVGVFIDGYPDQPHAIDPAHVESDFGPALNVQAGLLKTLRSYLVLLDSPDGATDTLVYRTQGRETYLETPGSCMTLDGVPYEPEAGVVDQDFAIVKAVTHEILAAGLPELDHSYAVLLADPKGPLGSLAFQSIYGSRELQLERAGDGFYTDGYPDHPHAIAPARLQRDFGPAMDALANTLKTMRSYLVLLESPDGEAGAIDYLTHGRSLHVEQRGEGLTLDGLPYEPDAETLVQDYAEDESAIHQILEAGLPELPHSYALLLEHDTGPLGSLSFQYESTGKQLELERASDGVFIDGYPEQAHAIDRQRIQRDFGPALDTLDKTFKALRSYIVLLKNPDGTASKVIFRTRGEELYLEHPGDSLTLDGIENIPDQQLSENDFNPAKKSTKQILDEGLPALPHSYVTLLDSPSGGESGEVEILEGIAKRVVLQKPSEAVLIDGYSDKVFILGLQKFNQDFADAEQAMPPPSVTYILYFDSGSALLSADSQALMPVVLDEIRKHPAADLSIDGHSDTVGDDATNDRLSLERSQTVAALIEKSGVATTAVDLAAYGKTRLAVTTPDNTAEPLNRRVEITIR